MMRKYFTISLLLISALAFGQAEDSARVTYDTIIPFIAACGQSSSTNKWVVRITRPVNYFTPNNPDTASRPVICTMQGDGEVSNGNYVFVNNYGPHYLLANGWDGSVVLGNGTHYPILITILQYSDNTRPWYVQPLMDSLIKEFHPRSLHVAGLSGGVEVMGWYMMYECTLNDEHNMANVKSFTNLSGVNPSPVEGTWGANPFSFPGGFGYWAHKYGGKYFSTLGDADSQFGTFQMGQNINDSIAGSAYFSWVNYTSGGSTHCCWNSIYDNTQYNWTNQGTFGNSGITTNGNAPNTAGTYVYNSVTGTNWEQWALRQGDTTLVGGCSPQISAGGNQTVQLPANSLNITGTVNLQCGGVSYTSLWTQVSGPNTAVISAPNSVTTNFTGLIVGTYVFNLAATDNNSQTGNGMLTVTVLQEQSPTVSAGSNQTIQLPNSVVTLAGSANGNGGATIPSNDTVWTQLSGPLTAVISTPGNSSTTITGLNVTGAYVFQLSVTDNNGNSAHSSVTITVVPAGTVNVRPKTIIGTGEYETFFIDLAGHLTSIGNIPYCGVGGVGTAGLPLPCVGAPGTTLPPMKNVWGGLHGGAEIDSNGNVWDQGDNVWTLGQGNTNTYNYVVQVSRDSIGNPFTNVVELQAMYVGPTSGEAQCWLARKGDGTMWIWGEAIAGSRGNGTDSTHADSTVGYPVQIIIPGGRSVAKIRAGQIGIALCTDGTVWTWTRPAFPQDLGYAWTGTQYQTPYMIATGAEDIAGGGGFNYYTDSLGLLHGWGSYGTCLGGPGASGRGTPIATPTFLTTLQSYFDAPIAHIDVNYVDTYCLTTKGSFYAWGDNAQGGVGIGSESNFGDSSSVQKPYAWNFLPVNIPVQYPVKILSGIQAFFSSQTWVFYMWTEDSSGNFKSWGRNKASLLGNGVVGCNSNMEGTYPNAWDITTPTAVYPSNLLYTVSVPVPWCTLYPAGSPCNQCTPATNAPPTITVTGGNTQNIPANQTTITLTSSAVPATGVKLATVLWTETSGPTTASSSSPATAATTFSGLSSGTYVFNVLWTDQNNKQANQPVTVNVTSSVNCHCNLIFSPPAVLKKN
jgi:hypothetical protein